MRGEGGLSLSVPTPGIWGSRLTCLKGLPSFPFLWVVSVDQTPRLLCVHFACVTCVQQDHIPPRAV